MFFGVFSIDKKCFLSVWPVVSSSSQRQARIAAVFRYLDPGGEGTVSQKALGPFQSLWVE